MCSSDLFIFFKAIKTVFPQIVTTDFIYTQTNQKEMSLDQLKRFILQMSSERPERRERTDSRDTRANYVRPARSAIPGKIKCTRCSVDGHLDDGSCPLERDGLWYCFCCKQNVPHKGKRECPEYKKRYEYRSNNYNRNYYRNNKRPRQNYEERTQNSDRHTNNDFRGGRGGGKSNNRGKYKNDRRNQRPYDKRGRNFGNGRNNQDKSDNRPAANKTGNDLDTSIKNSRITFIADSGASDHIIQKGFLLSNFTKSKNSVIKSANKNKMADIKIDGKGILYLKPDPNSENIIELNNVIAARDISSNLLSLRKFSDAGLGIYLDNNTLKIFNKETNQEIITGRYEKPNWVIDLSVVTSDSDDSEQMYENYSCVAQIVSIDEFLQQSQTEISDLVDTVSEGEDSENEPEISPSEIERENKQELTDSDLNEPYLNRKILDLNTIDFESIPKNLFIKKNNPKKTQTKLSDGMLWHMRLDHASLNYLRKLKKICPELKDIKFEDSIKDCETCMLSKMVKQPCL